MTTEERAKRKDRKRIRTCLSKYGRFQERKKQ